jgi:hypothetical protein
VRLTKKLKDTGSSQTPLAFKLLMRVQAGGIVVDPVNQRLDARFGPRFFVRGTGAENTPKMACPYRCCEAADGANRVNKQVEAVNGTPDGETWLTPQVTL